MAVQGVRHDVRRVRIDCARLVGRRALRGHGVLCFAADTGDRRADGAGARAPQVWWLVLRSALLQLAIGLGIGIGGAIGVARLLQSILVQSGTRDSTTLALIAALLAFVSLAACFLPARRATRLDPVNALRYE